MELKSAISSIFLHAGKCFSSPPNPKALMRTITADWTQFAVSTSFVSF